MSDDRSLTEFTADSADGESDADAEPVAADADTESVGDDVDAEPVADDADTESVGDDVDAEPVAAESDVDTESAANDVDTATITYRVQPAGADCSECGATTQRQWMDDGEFVCSDCKAW